MIARLRARLRVLETQHPVAFAIGLVLVCDAILFVSIAAAWGLSCAA